MRELGEARLVNGQTFNLGQNLYFHVFIMKFITCIKLNLSINTYWSCTLHRVKMNNRKQDIKNRSRDNFDIVIFNIARVAF